MAIDTSALLATVREKLDDLLVQATNERTHFYVGSVVRETLAALDGLETHIARLEGALEIIATTTYPATYLGMNERGMKMYGGSQDASNYARRILNGEQVT